MPGRTAVRRSIALLASAALLGAGAGAAATSAPAPAPAPDTSRRAVADTVVAISIDALNPKALSKLGRSGPRTCTPCSTRAPARSTPAPSTS